MKTQFNSTGSSLPSGQTTKLFDYKGNNVTFKNENGVTYVNATEMAQPFGKTPKDYLRTAHSQELINAITIRLKCLKTDVSLIKQGGGDPGTWMHEDVALDFAQWLSIDFKLWCNDRFKELLTIGMTAMPDTLERMLNDPDLVIGLATQVKALRLENEEAKLHLEMANQTIREQAPKVKYMEDVLSAPNLIPTTLIAKDLGLAANGLNKQLEHKQIIRKQSGVWVLTAKYQDKGYAHTKTHTYQDKLGQMNMVLHLYWTERGRAFINSLFGRGLTPT